MMYCPKCSEQRGQWVLPPRDLGYLSAGQLGNTLRLELATDQQPLLTAHGLAKGRPGSRA
jgi:hypothetical protein